MMANFINESCMKYYLNSIQNFNFLSFLFLNLFIFFSFSANADNFVNAGPPVINLKKIGATELSGIGIIMEDSQGFIWFTKDSGLLRYDGKKIKQFPMLSDFTTKNVTGIVEGKKGNLWIATTDRGLVLFDKKLTKLTVYNLNERFDLSHSYTNKNYAINAVIYKNKDLYITSKKQILIIDEQSMSVKKRLSVPLNEDDYIFRLFVDSMGGIWATNQTTMSLFLFHSDKLQTLSHQDNKLAEVKGEILSIFEDSQSRVWLGTETGVYLYLPESGTFKHYKPMDLTESLNEKNDKYANLTVDIVEDSEGYLWLGLFYNGLIKFDPNAESFERIERVKAGHSSLMGTDIEDLLFDKQGTLWVITNSGISQISKKTLNTARWINVDNDECTPLSITERKNDILFRCDNALHQLENGSVRKLVEFEGKLTTISYDNADNIWLGTAGHGAYKYNLNSTLTKNYDFNTGENDNLKVNTLIQLRPDVNGVLYGISIKHPQASNSGLVRYNPVTDSFSNLDIQVNVVDFVDINTDKMLLITGHPYDVDKALYWFDKKTQSKIKLPIDMGHVYAAQKLQQMILLSTEKLGLISIDLSSGEMSELNTKGIGNITGFYLYKENTLYVSTKQQFYLLTLSGQEELESQCITCTLTLENEGINGRLFGQLIDSNSFLTQDNRFFIASESELLSLDIDKLDSLKSSSQLMITDFKILNKSIYPSTDNASFLIDNSIEYTNKMYIQPETSFFSFSFAKVGQPQYTKQKYAYKMEGLSEDWLETAANNTEAIFSTLPAGSYIFKVKASDEAGRWQDDNSVKSIAIEVLPFWWRTWWAYCIYLVSAFILLSLAFWLFYRTKMAEKNSQSMTELAIVKENMLANLSHEFRTPLTLILGPVQANKQFVNNKQALHNLHLIELNAQRLLIMVDQLLELAQFKNIKNTQVVPQHVASVCYFVMHSFEQVCKEKSIQLSLSNRIDDAWWILGCKNGLETILFNLLTNAIKYSPSGGEVSLAVSFKAQGSSIDFSVTDSGCGIALEQQQFIFERFTRIDSSDYILGSGIGLALVKELVSNLSGQISVQSELNKGSCFCVTLPTGKIEREEKTKDYIVAHDVANAAQLSWSEKIKHQIGSINSSTSALNEVVAQNAAQTSNKTAKPTLLLVEDNVEIRGFIRQSLTSSYHILEADNGSIGLSIAVQEVPDIIITDVMMPEMDGFQLVESIRSEIVTCHIPVILLTAKGDKESRLKGLSDLADDYITKPFDIEELALRVQNLLGIRTILQARFNNQALQQPIVPTLNVSTNDTLQQDIVQENENVKAISAEELSMTDQLFYQRFEARLNELYSEADLNLSMISSQLAMSERQFQRKLKAVTGASFNETLRSYRLNQGRRLLVERDSKQVQIAIVADRVGFSSSTYFVRCFKAKYGITPSEYRYSEGAP